MKYEMEIDTPSGRQIIESDHPFTQDGIEKARSMFNGEPSNQGVMAKAKGQVKDVGSQVKSMYNDFQSNHDYNKKNVGNSIDPYGMFHSNSQSADRPQQTVLKNVMKIFGRGASMGVSRFAEGDSGRAADEYYDKHPAMSAIVDASGSFLPGGVAAKAAKAASSFVPKTALKSATKRMAGSGAYNAERQLMDSIGQDDEHLVSNVAKAAGMGAGVGGLSHVLSRAVPATLNRVNPIAAKKSRGIYGNRVKATNAERTGQIPKDIMQELTDYHARLGDIKNPNVEKLWTKIGQNPGAREEYLALPKKPSGNGGTYSDPMRKSFKKIRNVVAEETGVKTVPVPFTKLGGVKTGAKKSIKGYQKLTGGGYNPNDLVKLFGSNADELERVLGERMNVKAEDKVAEFLAKLLSNYGR
jgi:hypothetical protein